MIFIKKGSREHGSITIITAIILTAVITLNIVLYDYVVLQGKLNSMEPEMKLACNSLLASYDALLADKYGLCGFNMSSPYLEGKGIEYYFSSLEGNVEYLYDFTKPDVVQKQICDLMEIKAPINLAETIMEAVGIFEESNKVCDDHSVCAKASELLMDMQKKIENLENKVHGYFKGDVACVNGYNAGVLMEILDLSVDNNTSTDVLLKQVLVSQQQYYNYNNEANVILGELVPIYENIESLLALIPKESSALKSVLEIRNKASVLLNDTARKQINNNIKLFSERINVLKNFEKSNNIIPQEIKKLLVENEINSNIKINNVYAGNTNGETDQREKIQNEVKKLSEESFFSDCNYEIQPLEYAALPSVQAKTKTENAKQLIDVNSESFMNSFDSFERFFSYWDNFSFDKLSKDLKTKVLIDEYILSYMTNRIDLVLEDRLKNEVEYIIGGNASAQRNNNIVEQKILAFRFILNFVDIINDDEKCSSAEFLAIAVAAAISCGAGVTFYKYMILTCWALMQSYADVNQLLDGDSVPILAIFHEDNPITKKQNYDFYLRLILFFMDKQTKLMRISDVIQLNMKEFTGEEYKLSGIYTKVKATAVRRIDFIFPTLFGLEGSYKKEESYEKAY